MACAEFVNRIVNLGGGQQYTISLTGYFGRSTIFRLLRLFAISELIERQIVYADFSVDRSTVALLRFKRLAFRCMSSSAISLDHPNCDWGNQVEHVFHDVLAMISSAMIVEGQQGSQSRVIRFDEFNAMVSHDDWLKKIHPIPRILEHFSTNKKPILWVRLVALAQLCGTLLVIEGPRAGLTVESYDGERMLAASNDDFITKHRESYHQMLQAISSEFRGAA
jgi:hypothetical protein